MTASHNFAGQTYDPELDGQRLSSQFERVLKLMSDGRFRTLREIVQAVGGSEAGVSARLRDLRKEGFGKHTVERRRRGEESRGIWEYCLIRADRPKQMRLLEVNK